MPRRPRLEIPGVPVHLVHRGVNRAATFLEPADYTCYRNSLDDAFANHGIALHAYVFMGNHVHLLLTAPAAGTLSSAMCQLGRRYVPWFNRRHGRTGTLWEGRFKSCLVDSDSYLLTVLRYIELNPVRAAIAASPEDHPWSSARVSLGLEDDPLVTPHDTYLALGEDRETRCRAYRDWLTQPLDEGTQAAIRAHLQQERVLGDARFQAMAARTLNRAVALRPRGRPPREIQTPNNSGPFLG